jgi:GH43 family beta-xylosidase
MQLKSRFVFILLLFTSFSCEKKSGGSDNNPVPPPSENTFTNPLLASGPDPWVIKKEDAYYYTHTLGNRIGIWKTQKMAALKDAPVQTIWSAPATGPNSKNVWAPELHYLDNKWYAYYTAGASADLSTQRLFVLENTSSDPRTGIWTDKGKIYDPAADFFAIDGTVLMYNSSNYLLWSGQASDTDPTQRIYIARMTTPWTLGTARTLLSSPQYSWEMAGSPPAVNEAPQILTNAAGQVFIIYSASGCWTDDYSLGMLTLKAGGDPMQTADWTKRATPVFTKSTTNAAYGPGHNSFFKSLDGNEDWIIYHANSSPGQGCGDTRNPRMQKFTWNSDGTPNFGEPVRINTPIKEPAGE